MWVVLRVGLNQGLTLHVLPVKSTTPTVYGTTNTKDFKREMIKRED
jgi:hypothetical protein